MNTEHSAGLEIGEYSIRAELLPAVGIGRRPALSGHHSAGFIGGDNPAYALCQHERQRAGGAGVLNAFIYRGICGGGHRSRFGRHRLSVCEEGWRSF